MKKEELISLLMEEALQTQNLIKSLNSGGEREISEGIIKYTLSGLIAEDAVMKVAEKYADFLQEREENKQ